MVKSGNTEVLDAIIEEEINARIRICLHSKIIAMKAKLVKVAGCLSKDN